MLRRLLLALPISLIAVASPATVFADETGMASIHSWRKVGKKTCMVDHNHAGSGSGPSVSAATAEAVRDWAGFTALEYGSSWASWNVAIEKQVNCGRSNAGFSCDIVATPCRPW